MWTRSAAGSTRPGRLWAAAAGLCAVALGAAACSSVEPSSNAGGGASASAVSFGSPAKAGEVKQGGTLVVALSAEPDKLDPTLSRSLYSRYVFDAMCQKLYDVNQSTEVVPQLATALPKITDGGLTVTIPVRTGIKFADGTPFNAAAVKASLDRDLSLKTSARATELGPISGVDAPDDHTVVIHLKAPFAPLTAALADRAGMVMSPAALQQLGDNFASAPICVGPFKFAQRVPQNSISLVRDPNFYDADKVHLDGISYHILTDASIRAANLRSGDTQVADTLATQDVAGLRQDTNFAVLQSPSLGYQGITLNVGNVDGVGKAPKQLNTPLAQNAKVRQALDYSIDRKGLVQTVFNGLYDTACSPISPKSQYNSPAAQACLPHDPAKAKKMLADAGVQTPYSFTMLVSNNPATLRLAQALQAMVKDGGFDMKIQPVEYSTLLDQQDKGQFEVLQLGWSGRIDPDANITNFVGTKGSLNVSGYSNPSLDDAVQQARQTNDLERRKTLYGQAATTLQQDEPIIYLYRQSNLTGVTKKVEGVQVFPDGVIRVAFAGFTK